MHLRSFSLFGLSDVKLIFDDESENAWNREKVLERLAQVTLPPGVQPQMGTDWSPVGQIYFFTLQQHQSEVRRDGVEVARRLGAGEEVQVGPERGGCRQLRRSHARVSGAHRSRQADLLRPEHLAQVEQQLANNNANAGGSFIEAGLQQVNVREVGLVTNVHDIADTVIKTQNGTPLRVSDIAIVAQGPKIRLGQFGRAIHREDGKIVDNDDVVSGIVLLRKGADSDATLKANSRQGGGTERTTFCRPA